MRQISIYIQEKLRINQDTKILNHYTCHPKSKSELKSIVKERLDKDKNADLNDIDVSKITNIDILFYNLDPHNIKIDKWDVSNIQSMIGTFSYCKKFQGKGLENWNVSNVKNMCNMFYGCENFDCDLSYWNVSNVKYMDYMFSGCKSLKNTPSWYRK